MESVNEKEKKAKQDGRNRRLKKNNKKNIWIKKKNSLRVKKEEE